MQLIIPLCLIAISAWQNQSPSAEEILKKVDANLTAVNTVSESSMVIYGKRNSRTITSKSYGEGVKQNFTEYLSPARESGTKMLKIEDKLWIYSPSTDRIIQLSGHMLRQSVMGSDLSYEDMMESRTLTDIYHAKVVGNETYQNHKVWVLELVAKVKNTAYQRRKIWIDQQRFVPLKEELFAKSGQLLKRMSIREIMQIDGRWYPKKINYKDMLTNNKGTDFIIHTIKFNTDIPEYIFTKAVLKK